MPVNGVGWLQDVLADWFSRPFQIKMTKRLPPTCIVYVSRSYAKSLPSFSSVTASSGTQYIVSSHFLFLSLSTLSSPLSSLFPFRRGWRVSEERSEAELGDLCAVVYECERNPSPLLSSSLALCSPRCKLQNHIKRISSYSTGCISRLLKRDQGVAPPAKLVDVFLNLFRALKKKNEAWIMTERLRAKHMVF